MATNIMVSDETHSRLSDLKPFQSASFDDLIQDMIEQYDPPRPVTTDGRNESGDNA